VVISAFSDAGAGGVAWNGSFEWNSGVTPLTQELDWDPSNSTLSPSVNANGESRMAFFTVQGMAGTNAKIRLSVPNGFNTGLGDSIYVALGTAIPEPSAALLGVLGSLVLLRRRRAPG
jgi:hypothetical protein